MTERQEQIIKEFEAEKMSKSPETLKEMERDMIDLTNEHIDSMLRVIAADVARIKDWFLEDPRRINNEAITPEMREGMRLLNALVNNYMMGFIKYYHGETEGDFVKDYQSIQRFRLRYERDFYDGKYGRPSV